MANPSSTTSPNLGLTLFYEGVKVDNDTINSNWLKIDSAIGGSNMYEKLVGSSTFASTSGTITYPTTNFDFMIIKYHMAAGDTRQMTESAYGYGVSAIGNIKIVKPTANTTYAIPFLYSRDSYAVDMSYSNWTFTTTDITIPSSSYRGGMYSIEYYKYSTN